MVNNLKQSMLNRNLIIKNIFSTKNSYKKNNHNLFMHIKKNKFFYKQFLVLIGGCDRD